MSNKKENFKKNIKKSMRNYENTSQDTNEVVDNYENKYYDSKSDDNGIKKKREQSLKTFGIICTVIGVASMFLTNTSTVDTSETAKSALENKVSTAISAGTVLLAEDKNVEAKDHTITHKSDAKDTKIWVWDYAAEDGDYVQVIVDGTPKGEAFMIKHKAKEFTVPSVSTIEIKGIKDGGGGITYAVRYDINGISYFNGTPEGDGNTYTLTK